MSALATTERTEPSGAARIGERVKALREARGLSLRELASRCGVSAPMISQVERGETSPTLAVAARIAAGFDLTLSQLLRLDEGRHVALVRRRERARIRRDGHSVEQLSAPLPGQLAEVTSHTLKPGAATGGAGDPPMHEPGSREVIVVQSGAVTLVIDGDAYELGEGDSATFDADLPHHFENHGAGPAELLAVVTAGLRRA